MGIPKSERLSFTMSYDLTNLIEQSSIIDIDFAKSFIALDAIPKITVEHRVNESPNFLGFWIYGDGASVNIGSHAEIEFELLHNQSTGENEYTQTSLTMRVVDKKYKSDYIGYYKSRGKQLKNIQKRFDLLGCKAILILYHFVLNSEDKQNWIISEMFSRSELKRLFKELRIPKRFSGLSL